MKMSLHRNAKDKLFIKKADGRAEWLEKYLEGHVSCAWSAEGNHGTRFALKAWHYASSVDGAFISWGLPYIMNAVDKYSYSMLKSKVRICKDLMKEMRLPAKHLLPGL
eukprot:10915968-Lingulodinium_polyedra.AAC.1